MFYYFIDIQEQHRQEMSKIREEFLLVNKRANNDTIDELNDVITNMKKMHQDTLTDHKKDMERMKAKIAQHSLKVDSFKAVAEADLAEANYAKKLIDEQARILAELDIFFMVSKSILMHFFHICNNIV